MFRLYPHGFGVDFHSRSRNSIGGPQVGSRSLPAGSPPSPHIMNSAHSAVDSGRGPLALASGLTRDYLLHHRLCPRAVNADGVLIVAATADALQGGAADIAYAYRLPVAYEVVDRQELERLVERLTTRAERSVELARVDTNSDDLATDVRDLANQPPVIRYVNLGRRVALRTRWDPYCQQSAPACLSTIERTVWDGDQVLMELRSDVSVETEFGFDAFRGAVRYTHAGGIDEPLIVWKSDVGGWVPHRSWRGVYEAGTPVDGTSSNVTWPGQSLDVFYAPDARLTTVQQSNWMGSLVEGKTDKSGLQYMRNRYYDPRTGRFTQEDPIGLAGGSNLYGFAGGDPVNHTDPFGLTPDCTTLPCPLILGGAAVLGGPLTIFGVAVLGVVSADLAFGSSSGTSALSERAAADATAYSPGKRFSPKTKTQIDRDATAAGGQSGTCEYCGITLVPVPGSPTSTEYDHLQPKSKGGDNSPDNGRRSCRTCNRENGAKEKPDPRTPRPPEPPQQ